MFANSQFETKTTTEKGFIESFAKQIGDIGAIMIAILFVVFFTMLLAVTTRWRTRSASARASSAC